MAIQFSTTDDLFENINRPREINYFCVLLNSPPIERDFSFLLKVIFVFMIRKRVWKFPFLSSFLLCFSCSLVVLLIKVMQKMITHYSFDIWERPTSSPYDWPSGRPRAFSFAESGLRTKVRVRGFDSRLSKLGGCSQGELWGCSKRWLTL